MRIVAVNRVKDGAVLGRPIYHSNGFLLLAEGTKLTGNYRRVLQEIGVHAIYVDDAATRDILINDTIDPKTRQEAVSTLQSTFLTFKRVNSSLEDREKVIDNCRNIAERILEDLGRENTAIISLIDLKSFDNYTYAHSVNSAVLAGILGTTLDFGEEKLFKMVFGALLHDVGKITIPEPILNKKGNLSEKEMENVKKHPEDGWIILKDMYNVPPTSRNMSLQHHERFDGNGYPRGKSGMDIHEFARVMAIVDVFDALTSDRPYRKRYPAHEALEYIYGGGNSHFDINLVKIFVAKIAPYPLATCVELSSGEQGVIARIDSQLPSRPTVKVTHDKNGKELSNPYDLDLTKKIDITISEVTDDADKDNPDDAENHPNKGVGRGGVNPPETGPSRQPTAESSA